MTSKYTGTDSDPASGYPEGTAEREEPGDTPLEPLRTTPRMRKPATGTASQPCNVYLIRDWRRLADGVVVNRQATARPARVALLGFGTVGQVGRADSLQRRNPAGAS